MFWKARDLKVKLEISMAVDLGWRISDFLSIQVSELPDLNHLHRSSLKEPHQKNTHLHTLVYLKQLLIC